MNKKLMAVAIAGALAAPGFAFAQSSVTISGIFKVGAENLNYSNASPTRLNSSQNRVVDNSSRIIFGVTEDLGNGLAAVAQLDVRFKPDGAMAAPTSDPIGAGNTWVGLSSKTLGRLTMGRHDLHYGKAPDDTATKAGALEASAVSLFDYIGSTSIANGSRTQNVVRYDLPTMNGFDAIIAWSSNPVGTTEADMSTTNAAGVTTRKGDGWNVNPQYTNGPFQVGYSYWRAKPDAPVAATTDQRGDSIYGYYKFGGFKVGLGWNRSKLESSTTGIKVAERDAWSLPMSYNWGPHNIVGHYTRAGNISSNVVGATTSDTGAKMVSVAYVYDLSKRTSVGLTYSRIDNDMNANYNFFTSSSLGSTDSTVLAGEKPRLVQATVRHAF